MEMDALRREVRAILAAEESSPPNWLQVEQLTHELLRLLEADSNTECPEIVSHYLDDADIRARDEVYGAHQRATIRRFVETGEYINSTPMPWWTWAPVAVLVGSLVLWLFS